MRLRPWVFGAIAWMCISLVIIIEYLRMGESKYLNQFWFLLSLLWLEFGFAGLFYLLVKRRGQQLTVFIMVTLIPPLVLYLLILIISRWIFDV